MAFQFPIIMTICANVLYHICQKATRQDVSPFVAMMATYIVGAILCAIIQMTGLFSSPTNTSVLTELTKLNWASYILGLAIVLLEVGFLLAYRSGWNINIAAIYSNVAVGVLLVPVGYFFFREQMSHINAIGVIVAITGLAMMGNR